MPADAETAAAGAWKRGPGRAPFDAARAALGELPLIAEDLGVITPPVKRAARVARAARAWRSCSSASRRRSATPSTCPSCHEENQVVYTGTHDNDTIRGWYEALAPAQRALVAEALERRGIARPTRTGR